jgi:hypothetical protein
VIVEPNSSGHHFYYVKLLVQRGLALGEEYKVVLLTTHEAKSSREYRLHLGEFKNLETITLSPESMNLAELSSNPIFDDASFVTFPEADRLLVELAMGRWRVSTPTSFLVMRPDGEPKRILGLKTLIGITKKFMILREIVSFNIPVVAMGF